MRTIEIFIGSPGVSDERQVTPAMTRPASSESLGSLAARVSSGGDVASCSRAMAAAADGNRHLLVMLGDIDVGCEAVGVLLEAIDDDPMIGFAIPRLKGSRDDALATLGTGGDRAVDELPRRLLSEIPDTYLVADTPARCVLIAPEVLADFGGLDERFRSLGGALWHYIGRARRCGFRTVVCNRAIVAPRWTERPCPPCAITGRTLPVPDRVLLRELLPDADRTHDEFGTHTIAAAETRVARALPKAYGTRPSLLLDVRNTGRAMNGTAMATLGVARGLYALDSGWDVALLARREASTVHALASSFPNWPVYTDLPDRQFTAALRLSQPWHVQEMIDLHRLAAYNLYLFLDTISWDTAYPAPRRLQGTWEFMADHADGLVCISEFTRDRFRRRFPAGAAIPTLVSHLSFEPDDYIRSDWRVPAGQEAAIFVVGNGYDHKDVSQTIELLTCAFPYQPLVALGPVPAPTPRVTVLESGTLSEVDLHRLYAGSRAVVFPSFYEGFGFPIVMTLAYGRTLLARRSALLEEIAAQCPPRGRLVPFDRREQLVELVGRLLHGEDVPALPLGTALEHKRPKSWRDVGASIVTFLSDLTGDLSRSRWRPREHAIRQLLAAGGDVSASTDLAVSR